MKRRFFCAGMLCTLMLLLCTGCGVYVSFLTVGYTQPLQEGEQVVILLHPPEGMVDEAAERPETEIGQYCEDGWMAAEYGPLAVNATDYVKHFERMFEGSELKTGITEVGGWWHDSEYAAFCRQYGCFRCALTDAEGNILGISGECSLLPGASHRSSPDIVRLDPETMTLTPVHWLPVVWKGRTLRYWARWACFFAVNLGTPLFVHLLFAKRMRKWLRYVLSAFCLLPAAVMLGLYLAEGLLPMLRESTEIDPTWFSEPLVGLIFMAAAASGTYSKKAHKAQTEASKE